MVPIEVCWLFCSQLLEFDDVNDTADPATSDLLPPYELQDFSWSRLNLSGYGALLCGAAATFANGSLCLQVRLCVCLCVVMVTSGPASL